MLEEILSFLSQLDITYLYLILFLFSFIENVFPPSPSDVVIIVGSSLIASTTMGYFPILFLTSIGSALGFILMYYVGYFLSEKILLKGKLKLLSPNDLKRTGNWFSKYGFKLILANRFLPGTRSVISFFSGVHELDVRKTFLFAAISAFAWNAIIIYFGMALGNNVGLIDFYLSTYSNIIILITLLVILVFIIKYLIKKKKEIKN